MMRKKVQKNENCRKIRKTEKLSIANVDYTRFSLFLCLRGINNNCKNIKTTTASLIIFYRGKEASRRDVKKNSISTSLNMMTRMRQIIVEITFSGISHRRFYFSYTWHEYTRWHNHVSKTNFSQQKKIFMIFIHHVHVIHKVANGSVSPKKKRLRERVLESP
jgi:hypothetical protein